MIALLVAAALVAVSSASILWLLFRLDPLQVSRARPIFLRRWSYILASANYDERARPLLRRLRLTLGVLGASVVVLIWSVLALGLA